MTEPRAFEQGMWALRRRLVRITAAQTTGLTSRSVLAVSRLLGPQLARPGGIIYV